MWELRDLQRSKCVSGLKSKIFWGKLFEIIMDLLVGLFVTPENAIDSGGNLWFWHVYNYVHPGLKNWSHPCDRNHKSVYAEACSRTSCALLGASMVYLYWVQAWLCVLGLIKDGSYHTMLQRELWACVPDEHYYLSQCSCLSNVGRSWATHDQ